MSFPFLPPAPISNLEAVETAKALCPEWSEDVTCLSIPEVVFQQDPTLEDITSQTGQLTPWFLQVLEESENAFLLSSGTLSLRLFGRNNGAVREALRRKFADPKFRFFVFHGGEAMGEPLGPGQTDLQNGFLNEIFPLYKDRIEFYHREYRQELHGFANDKCFVFDRPHREYQKLRIKNVWSSVQGYNIDTLLTTLVRPGKGFLAVSVSDVRDRKIAIQPREHFFQKAIWRGLRIGGIPDDLACR